MVIDCDTCEVRGKACSDCVVSFLTIEVRPAARQPAASQAVTVDADQAAAMEALANGGLVPPLRLVVAS